MKRNRWGAFAAMAALLAVAGAAQADGIQWRASVPDALREAAQSNRLVMIDFDDNDCEWCERMDKETLADAEVAQACQRIIPVRVKIEEARELAEKYEIRGVPSFIFVESSGDEVGRIEGFMPPPAFLESLGEVLSEQDKVVSLRSRVTSNPEDHVAQADLARIYLRRRQGDMAAPLVDALHRLPAAEAPEDMSEILLNTAIAFGSRGNNDKALVYLDRVIKGYPGSEDAEWAEFFTGLALGLKGEREAAIRQLEKVSKSAKTEAVRDRARLLLERFQEEPPVPTL